MSEIGLFPNQQAVSESLLIGAVAGYSATYLGSTNSLLEMFELFILYVALMIGIVIYRMLWRRYKQWTKSEEEDQERIRYDWDPHRAS